MSAVMGSANTSKHCLRRKVGIESRRHCLSEQEKTMSRSSAGVTGLNELRGGEEWEGEGRSNEDGAEKVLLILDILSPKKLMKEVASNDGSRQEGR